MPGSGQYTPSSASIVKRHNSLNIRQRLSSRPMVTPPQSPDAYSSLPYFSETSSAAVNNGTSVNTRLYQYLSKRHFNIGTSRVFLNTFWLDNCADLETYHQTVRKSLLSWFTKLLANASYLNQIDLQTDFHLDFCIVLVIRNESIINGNLSKTSPTPPQPVLLSANKLVESKPSKGLFKNSISSFTGSSNKLYNNGTSNTHKPATNSLNRFNSSSTSSLNVLNNQSDTKAQPNNASEANSQTTSARHQLIEQIHNDLIGNIQLFQQSLVSNNSSSTTPVDLFNCSLSRQVSGQLRDKIVILNVNSNSSGDLIGKDSQPALQNFLPSSSASNNNTNNFTSKTFSALSNFSSSSINKISSPSKGSLKSKLSSSATNSATTNSLTLPPLNYNSFVQHLRSLLVVAFGRQCDIYERLVRQQRELLNRSEWDFFGFFLLQEELAFVYEHLSLYDRALIQYDELDALFTQSIINSNGIADNQPWWLRKRMIFDDVEEHDDEGKHSSALYSVWNGLCLCNPKAAHSLRTKIVNCLHQEGEELIENKDTETCGQLDSPTNKTSSSIFSDPLGVKPKPPQRRNRITSTSSQKSLHSTQGQISLIDFRNYLFSRQVHLLSSLNEPWACRALPFLQTCLFELRALNVRIVYK